MAGKLLEAGWSVVPDGQAQVCIVNTCAFVEDAAQESVDILKEQVEQKQNGEYELLIATGCLPEKYQAEITGAIAGVDAEIGTEDFVNILPIVNDLLSGKGQTTHLSPKTYLYDDTTPRLLSGPPWRAYLKLSEGCDNACSYCIIGRLRGKFRSRTIESVVAEAQNLAEMGVRELILVAQDVTNFGADKKGAEGLAELLGRLDQIEKLDWIRLLYAHPAHLTVPMLEAMKSAKRVVPYLDLPLQHISDPILKSMNRKTTQAHIENLLDKAKEILPDLFIRTTFIVGLPGETEEDFQTLMEFVERRRFAHVGVFTYSPEQGTPAFTMQPQVPEEVALLRQETLMLKQQEITEQVWQSMIGKKVDVLIEEELLAQEEDDYTHIGRFYGQAPEIDGVTYCRLAEPVALGQILCLEVIDGATYDLFAKDR
jgi:ribosomal protein S12 methylthiotransferase